MDIRRRGITTEHFVVIVAAAGESDGERVEKSRIRFTSSSRHKT